MKFVAVNWWYRTENVVSVPLHTFCVHTLTQVVTFTTGEQWTRQANKLVNNAAEVNSFSVLSSAKLFTVTCFVLAH